MPLSDSLLNLKGYVIDHLNGINPIQVVARFTGDIFCPHCGSKNLRKKTTFRRVLRHESIGNRRCELHLTAHKFHCRNCFKYFNQRFPGILKWYRSTEAFRREVFEKHHLGISQVDLARSVKIGAATIERWYHFFLKKKESEIQDQHYPKYLGIDEHFFSRKHGFVTTLCSLDRHRILDILPGKSREKILPHLKRIKGRESVEMVCMDLCDHYRSIVKDVFPNARIVADRFHVIRLINQAFLKTWHLFDPNAKYSRGLLSLMRRHAWHLKPDQIPRLNLYFEKFPGLKPIYDFKQNLVRLLLKKHRTASQAKRLIPRLLNAVLDLQNSHFDPLVTLGNTLHHWREEIACMWRFTKSNGITEGFHRKMKLIQRRAYGFKNFENYRLRVCVLCC